jgi:hypothetical protein
MQDKISIIVTSIAAPNKALQRLAEGCGKKGYDFIVIGDQASPQDFHLDGCDFYGLDRQLHTGLKLARGCPMRHYARKNIGYLLAMQNGCSLIIETDDDNIATEEFWDKRQKLQKVRIVENQGWVNAYNYFSDENIWPRGYPLEYLKEKPPAFERLEEKQVECPIQQGLADENPDIDAIYRLILPLPQRFRKDRRLALGDGSWCPFNSQNTTWWPQAFELLYLPAYCSFRMTDIWRSFIAQKIAWVNGWAILFHEPTMVQERNEHNLLKDFSDEIAGYLNNDRIRQELESLDLKPGVDKIADNLRVCYEKLVGMGLIGPDELKLLDAWLEDIRQLRK